VGQALGGASIATSSEDDSTTMAPLPVTHTYECNYDPGSSPSIALTVTCSEAPNTAQVQEDFKQTVAATGRTITDVGSIGDSAFWSAPAPDSGSILSADQLYVYVGSSLQVSILVHAGAQASFDPQSAAEQLAKLVVGRL
jgi:hypothetical protein